MQEAFTDANKTLTTDISNSGKVSMWRRVMEAYVVYHNFVDKPEDAW